MKNTKYKKKYTTKELQRAAQKAFSKREFGFLLCGYHPGVNKLKMLLLHLTRKNIDISHWKGRYQARNTKRNFHTNEEIFKKDSFVGTGVVRDRILKEKLLSYKCEINNCPPFWFGKPLTLHLDHIDGNKLNNELKNLRFLCPNCHQQTETWGPANKNKKLPTDIELLVLFKKGLQYKDIAIMYNVHPSTVSHRFKIMKENNKCSD